MTTAQEIMPAELDLPTAEELIPAELDFDDLDTDGFWANHDETTQNTFNDKVLLLSRTGPPDAFAEALKLYSSDISSSTGNKSGLDIIDDLKWTPLIHASFNGHLEICKLIISFQESIYRESITSSSDGDNDNDNNNTDDKVGELFKIFLSRRVKWNGSTALHLASARGHTNIVDLLITESIKYNGKEYTIESVVNAADYDEATPLHCAVLGKHYQSASLLLKHGAVTNKPDIRGKSALHWAESRQQNDYISLLTHFEKNNRNDDLVNGEKKQTKLKNPDNEDTKEEELICDLSEIEALIANVNADESRREAKDENNNLLQMDDGNLSDSQPLNNIIIDDLDHIQQQQQQQLNHHQNNNNNQYINQENIQNNNNNNNNNNMQYCNFKNWYNNKFDPRMHAQYPNQIHFNQNNGYNGSYNNDQQNNNNNQMQTNQNNNNQFNNNQFNNNHQFPPRQHNNNNNNNNNNNGGYNQQQQHQRWNRNNNGHGHGDSYFRRTYNRPPRHQQFHKRQQQYQNGNNCPPQPGFVRTQSVNVNAMRAPAVVDNDYLFVPPLPLSQQSAPNVPSPTKQGKKTKARARDDDKIGTFNLICDNVDGKDNEINEFEINDDNKKVDSIETLLFQNKYLRARIDSLEKEQVKITEVNLKRMNAEDSRWKLREQALCKQVETKQSQIHELRHTLRRMRIFLDNLPVKMRRTFYRDNYNFDAKLNDDKVLNQSLQTTSKSNKSLHTTSKSKLSNQNNNKWSVSKKKNKLKNSNNNKHNNNHRLENNIPPRHQQQNNNKGLDKCKSLSSLSSTPSFTTTDSIESNDESTSKESTTNAEKSTTKENKENLTHHQKNGINKRNSKRNRNKKRSLKERNHKFSATSNSIKSRYYNRSSECSWKKKNSF